MNAPLARFFAIILFAWLAVAHADQPGETEDKAKLVTRVYRVPSAIFFPQATEKNAEPNTQPKELSATSDGEVRYDVWNFLTAWGVEKVGQCEAIFLKDSNALVVTCSAELQDFVERLVGLPECGEVVKSIATSATLWEYEEDQFADFISGMHSFAELRQRAGNSLKLVASQFLATKSGQRTAAVSKQLDKAATPVAIPQPKPANGTTAESAPRINLDGARGSFFEVEPTIGPDGEMLDMTIRFDARFKRLGAEQDTEISVTTSLTLRNNRDTIPYCSVGRDDGAPAQQGKVIRHALVISARVMDADGRTNDERAKQCQQEDEKLIRKARAGLGASKK